MQPKDLQINPILRNKLDTEDFCRILDNNAQGYKFYWFESIMDILPNKSEMTFKEIMCKMIWEAWFLVAKYHLHLGPMHNGHQANLIESLIIKIEEFSDIGQPMNEKYLQSVIDENFYLLIDDFNKLSTNVPYRFLSPFINSSDEGYSWNRPSTMIAYFLKINEEKPLPYIIIDGVSVSKRVAVNHLWKQVILDNYSLIKHWINEEKDKFLMKCNQEIHGTAKNIDDNKKKTGRQVKVSDLL